MSADEYFNGNQPYSSQDYYGPQQQHETFQESRFHANTESPYNQGAQGYQQPYAAHLSQSYDDPQARPMVNQYAYNSYTSAMHSYAYQGEATPQSTYNHSGQTASYQEQPYAPDSHSNFYPPPSPSQGQQHDQHLPPYSSNPPLHAYQPQTSPRYDGEKGVAGALAGGALGAYAGHQVNHGVIGAVGGAIAGSKLEDHYKKDDKKKKDKKSHFWKRRHSNSSSGSSSSSSSSDDEKAKPVPLSHSHHQYQPQPVMAGNFSSSCTSITLDGDYDLIALCRAVDGQQKLSSISLNNLLTNSDGQFHWARGGNFGVSARNVQLLDNGKILEAELGMGGDRGWNRTIIRLDEKITNDNGELRFLD